MNNMKYYNESLAYDFERFKPRTQAENQNIVKMPKTVSRSRARSASKPVSITALSVFAVGFMLFALCGNIFLRIRINEVNSEINSIKSEISTLESEKTSLEVEFERRISYSNVELEASELGMQKMDKDQVKYIRVQDKNSAVTEKGTTFSSQN